MSLDFGVTKVFERNYASIKRVVVNRGGTRSSKTHSLCQLLIIWLFTGFIGVDQYIGTGYASVVRKTLPALRATAERTLIQILKDHDLYSLVDHHKTDRTITYGERVIEFFSVDDAQKVRGREREILFCNEANELSFDDFNQLSLRSKHKIFLDFNPDDIEVWINTEIEQRRAHEKKDVDVIVSNYKWNGFLSQLVIDEIEYLKEVDPILWEVFGRGNYGVIQGLIYPSFKIVDEFPAYDELTHFDFGLDFGFVHPQVFVAVGFREATSSHKAKLFLDELYYESYKTNADFIEYLDESNFIHNSENAEIIADSAQPGMIEEIRKAGFRITKANKDAGSVSAGIGMMRALEINVTARSVNIMRELRKYKYKDRKEGDVKEAEPIKLFDDALDAARYVVYTRLYNDPRKTKKVRRKSATNMQDARIQQAQRSIRTWNKKQ